MTAVLVLCLSLLVFTTGSSEEDFDRSKCNRNCVEDPTPRICEYDMKIETYTTMSKACGGCPGVVEDCDRTGCVMADGYSRQIYAVNRKLPSPEIRVCEGDRIVARVINEMSNGESTSMHWHGIHLPGKPYMDGVAMLTQCPILPLNEFVYNFTASPAGTHYYHAHVGMQRGDGIAGALIVNEIKPRYPQYIDESPTTLLIQDWYHRLGLGQGMLHLFNKETNVPDTFIMNGKSNISREEQYQITNVTQGETYRFRIINNGVMNCPIKIHIEDHNITAIATDGADIEEVETQTIVVSGGERWDFLLSATQETNNYWIVFQGEADCENVTTHAILHYSGAGPTDLTKMIDPVAIDVENLMTVNPFNKGMISPDSEDGYVTLKEMKSADSQPDWLSNTPDISTIYLLLGLHKINNDRYNKVPHYPCIAEDGVTELKDCTVLAQIDHIFGLLPPSPYLTHYKDIDPATIKEAGSDDEKDCSKEFCEYIHRLQVTQGDVVELVIIDEGKYWNISNHPMHIHGQYFYVVDVGQAGNMEISKDTVELLDGPKVNKREFSQPIRKDTIMMPTGGYVVVRFKAENSGPWLFHCHNELHVEQGMFMVIDVRARDSSEAWPTDPQEQNSCGAPPLSPPVCTIFDPFTCSGVEIMALVATVVGAAALLVLVILFIMCCCGYRCTKE